MQNVKRRRTPLLAAAVVTCATSGVFAQVIDLSGTTSVSYSNLETPDNFNARDTTNAEVISNPPYNLSGTGLTVGVWEADNGWVRTTHQELAGRVTTNDSGGALSDHATHVAGTIAAKGIDPFAKGMATNINIRSYTSTNDLTEMAAAAGIIAASNHSYSFARGWTLVNWGAGPERSWFGDRTLGTEDTLFGKYDINSRNLDATLHSNPNLLSVWSASNDNGEIYNDQGDNYPFPGTYVAFFSVNPGDGAPIAGNPGFYRVNVADHPLPGADGSQHAGGYDTLPQQQVAKNGLVVGAISPIVGEGPTRGATLSNTSDFSSWGPADDGRMAVHVVADGVGVYSSTAGSDSSYGMQDGTSSSAPGVSGTMALVIQHLMNNRHVTTIPKAATSKALAIHTALDILTTGPDYKSGYGVMDGQAAAKFIDETFMPTPTNRIIEGSYAGSETTIALGALGGNVKATLVWTDVEGAANTGGLNDTTKALVNDLDLWITDDLSNTYYPWTLDPNNPANAAVQTTRNALDNVEQVLWANVAAGTSFTVHVGLTGGLTGASQDWSLLITGVPEPTTILGLVIPAAMLLRPGRKRRQEV